MRLSRNVWGPIGLVAFIVFYAVFDMGMLDGIRFPQSFNFLRGATPTGGSVYRMPAPAPAPAPSFAQVRTTTARSRNDDDGDVSSSLQQNAGGMVASTRDTQLARWFDVASKAANDATDRDCSGSSAAEWKTGCTLGRRGRWFAGRA